MNKRRQQPVTLMLAAAAALMFSSCGGSSGAADAGSGQDVGTTDAAVDGVITCDPAAQDCPGAQKCDFICPGSLPVVTCGDDGSSALGAACSFSMPCAKGTGCLALPSGGGAICRKYCAGDGDCATGERCHNDNVSVRCSGPVTTFLLHFCY